MSMNMDAAIRIKANVQGGNAIQAFNRDLKGLDGAAKLSGAELGRMNIAINRMAREAGNTTAGLRQHVSALQSLRDRTEIGSKAYNRLGREIDQIRGKLQGLDGQAEKTGATLKNKLIGGLAALGVGRLAGGITRTAANFDAELRKAAAIEGGGNFEKLKKDIEGVAAVAAGTPTEVAKLATALSRAGFTAQETGQALRGIVLGAEATDVAFEEMGSIAADAMRSMGIEVSKTSGVIDILVKTANSSNQTVLDLGESLKYAAPIARSLGVNINDLSATMAILANNGIRGSEAGTALRTGLGRLQLAASGGNEELLGLTRGSTLLANAMKTLGADVVDSSGKLKPMDDVLISLKQNLEKLPQGVQVEVLKALFGDEAGGKLRAALNSTEEDIRKMFATIRESGGATEQTREQMRGFADSMKVLGGNVEIVTNAIGEKFAMVLKPLADGLSAAIGWTQTWPQPLRDVAAAAAAAGIAVGGFVVVTKGLSALGAVAAIKGIAAALGTATVAAKAFTVALLANPIGLIAAGLVAATVAAYNFNKPFKEFVDSIPQRMGIFWQSLTNDATSAMNRVKEQWAELQNFVGETVKNIQGMWQRFTQWFGSLWERIKNFVKERLQAIGVDTEWLGKKMSDISTQIQYYWDLAFRNIQINWRGAVANMINYTNPLFNALKQLGIDVGKATADAVFGDLPPMPQQPRQTSNVIPAAPVTAGSMSMSDLVGGGSGSGAAGAAGGAGSGGRAAGAQVAKGVKELLRLTDEEIAAAVNTAIGEYGGPDPRGRTDVFANILARSRSSQYPSNLVDVVTQSGQYAPNFGRSRSQVTNPNLYGRALFDQVKGELMDAQMLSQSIRDVDSRLYFKGISQQKNMVRGVDFLRAPDQNFFHGPGRTDPGRNPQITTQLLQELGGGGNLTGYIDQQTQSLEQQQQILRNANVLLQSYIEDAEDLGFKLEAVGAKGANALGVRYSEAITQANRKTREMTLRVVELNEQSGNNLDITAFKEVIDEIADGYQKLADAELTEGMKGMLPSLEGYEQQISELTLALENRKNGITQLTEVQKIQIALEQQGLLNIAALNDANREHINKLVERAQKVDELNKKLAEKSFDQGLQEQMQGLGRNLGDTLMSAFDNLINKTKTWKEFMSDALKQIGSQLLRMGLNMAAGPMGSGGILSFLGFGFEKGGIMTSKGAAPLKAYSRGGIANSPQLALFGEGSQPEAYVPLPDGRRIPVAMQAPRNDNSRMRDVMGASPAAAAPPTLNMKFETTKINGVEYVSREQLETAMAQTRRRAASDGAKRGMSMTLDKLQQSPATRSKVGIR
jgi:TP901 family phage tail tape measure protein